MFSKAESLVFEVCCNVIRIGPLCFPVIHAAELQLPTKVQFVDCVHAELWTSVFQGPTSIASCFHVLWLRFLAFLSVSVSEAMVVRKRPASRAVATHVVAGHPAYRLVKDPRPVKQVARAPAFKGLEYCIARCRFSGSVELVCSFQR